MKIYGLRARIRRKRKYSSYQGEVKVEISIQIQYEASKRMEKYFTNVTEFSMLASNKKLSLSLV